MLATLAFTLIVAAAIACAVGMFRGREERASVYLLVAAAALLVVELVRRSAVMGFPALTGLFESLVFYSAATCAVTAVYGSMKRYAPLAGLRFGMIIVALGLLAVASSPLAPKDVQAPVPALRSGWLVAHVAFSFLGEALFAASFVASVLYLARPGDEEGRKRLERVAYLSAVTAYPVFTMGALVFGAVWARTAWGRWWSWDPKETWALVTWLVYTVYLHARLILHKRGAVLAWLNVVGFACTLFTLLGVNFLLSGLHSYR